MRFHDDESTSYLQSRIPPITLVLFLFFGIAIGRLFYLQILSGDKYISLATETFVREEETIARRGNILDRNNIKIADTRPYFEITLTPQYLEHPNDVIHHLAEMFPIDEADVKLRLAKAHTDPAFMPVVVAEDISFDWAAKLREQLSPEPAPDSPYLLSGVSLQVTPIRRYLFPELFSHALGYLREVDKDQLEKLGVTYPGVYSRGDLTGAAGVEESYDIKLKGQDGQLGRVVDARGREITDVADVKVLQEWATIPPRAGYHLRTTLDFDAQKAASSMFMDDKGKVIHKGAVVALDPNTGEILVMYSSPGFDANRVMKGNDPEYWKKINLDPDKFLFNRAIQGMYPPASTYKPMAAVAGVVTGAIDPVTTKINCGGGMQFGNRFFQCCNIHGHGPLDLIHGIEKSCDVFFYNVALRVGVDGLAKIAKIMGYGSTTGIDIPFEKSGLVPTSAWKKARYGQDWIESETLSIGIGQSYDLVTPLQNAKVVSMIANGGYAVTPHLGQVILNQDGSVYKELTYPKKTTDLTGASAIEWVKKGMIQVVQGNGTAARLKVSPYKIAGKTGTAQVIGHESTARRGKSTENHALFIGFAPYDDPKIAISVIVENGGYGATTAAPVAMKVIDTYLRKLIPLPNTNVGEEKNVSGVDVKD